MFGLTEEKVRKDLEAIDSANSLNSIQEESLKSENRGKWTDWVMLYKRALAKSEVSDEDRKRSMDQVNPKFILRNYLMQ